MNPAVNSNVWKSAFKEAGCICECYCTVVPGFRHFVITNERKIKQTPEQLAILKNHLMKIFLKFGPRCVTWCYHNARSAKAYHSNFANSSSFPLKKIESWRKPQENQAVLATRITKKQLKTCTVWLRLELNILHSSLS